MIFFHVECCVEEEDAEEAIGEKECNNKKQAYRKRRRGMLEEAVERPHGFPRRRMPEGKSDPTMNKMEQFLRALERIEVKSALTGGQSEEPRLSTQMRDSWKTRHFWFNYAARKSMDVDAVYWSMLREDGAGVELLDEETRAEMEPFTRMKMMQLEAYREQCAAAAAPLS